METIENTSETKAQGESVQEKAVTMSSAGTMLATMTLTNQAVSETKAQAETALGELDTWKVRTKRLDILGTYYVRVFFGLSGALVAFVSIGIATIWQSHVYPQDKPLFFTWAGFLLLICALVVLGTTKRGQVVYKRIVKGLTDAILNVPDKALPWMGILLALVMLAIILGAFLLVGKR